MVAAAGSHVEARLEAVDWNGLLPPAATIAVYPTAHAFRRFLRRELPRHLAYLDELATWPTTTCERSGSRRYRGGALRHG